MLVEIAAYDYAIMKRARLELGPGFNVISGETGAGKSLLIGALELALGQRASDDMIGAGADRARIEVVLDLGAEPELRELLSEAGFGGHAEAVIKRELVRGGRNIARVNESAATTAFLERLGAALVDIHGQHDHQRLLDPGSHRAYLDRSGGPGLAAELDALQRLWTEHRDLSAKIADLERAEAEREREIDLLNHQAAEIDAADPRPHELDQLETERRRLANRERLVELTEAVLTELGAGAAASEAARDRMGAALGHLEDLAEIDPGFGPAVEQCALALDGIERLIDLVRKGDAADEYDPGRLQEVEDRVHALKTLARKYGGDMESVLDHARRARERLELLRDSDAALEALETRRQGLEAEMRARDQALLKRRRTAAAGLQKAVTAELGELAMEKARFKVEIRPRTDLAVPGRYGGQDIRFLLQANPGQDLKPLSDAASGGEASRIMLALKTVLSRADTIPVMVFDEIDAGVGGDTARAVGRRLALIGRDHQVLCVTHLPQIAAYADHHCSITKSASDSDTEVAVQRLATGAERIGELARMLGLVEGAKSSQTHAKTLLADADKWKKSLKQDL